MKDKLLNAMREASERCETEKRLNLRPTFPHRYLKTISDAKHVPKDIRLHQAMYLTAFGL